MGAVRKVLPYLTQGVLLCLFGGAFYFLWRRLLSVSSETSSEVFEEKLNDLNSWQRKAEAELATQFDRIRSIAGRVDRSKRKDSAPEGNESGEPELAQGALDEQSRLNALLAKKFHG